MDEDIRVMQTLHSHQSQKEFQEGAEIPIKTTSYTGKNTL